MNAADKIRKMARDAASEKIASEKEKLESKVNADIEVIEQVLELVKSRLIYKEIKGQSYRPKYVCVTEEMVMDDYTNKGNSYHTGVSIKRLEGNAWHAEHTLITVNGHVYYHAADIFVKYKWNIEHSIEKSQRELDILREKQDRLRAMEELEPAVKQIMLDYQARELDKVAIETN